MAANRSLPNIKRRTDFPTLIDKLGFRVAAEVGVFEGIFSRYLLEKSKLERLYSIDPWTDTDGKVVEGIFQKAQDALSQFGDRSQILRMTGASASLEIPDDSLDFVYIDANHSYESAKDDIETWFKKVKAGGVLSGHDYKNRGRAITRGFFKEGSDDAGCCEVKRAVDEFVASSGVDLNVMTRDRASSWWFVKD